MQLLLIEKPSAFSLLIAGWQQYMKIQGASMHVMLPFPSRKDVITKYFAFLYLAIHILHCSLGEPSSLVTLNNTFEPHLS